jgi:RNA polymerase sigma-70 factor (ECF subfamily)
VSGEIRPDLEQSLLSDEEVVSRVLAGDTASYEILMRRYNQRIYRVARSVLRDEAEAEDVMQHAYVEALAHLVQWSGRASFEAWVGRIAFHDALARLRKRRRERALGRPGRPGRPEEDVMGTARSSNPSPEQQAFQGEMRVHLESAIDALPTLYRTVFVMRNVEGLSTAETAACLGIREDAVKTRVHRARALLREDLYRRTGAETASAFTFERPRCDRVVAAVLTRVRSSHKPAATDRK